MSVKETSVEENGALITRWYEALAAGDFTAGATGTRRIQIF